MTSKTLLDALGSDAIEPSDALFAAAAKDPAVITALRELAERAARNPRGPDARDVNRLSWAPYVFAENGDPALAAPLYALLDQKADDVRRFAGAYADFDLPSIMLRLAGAKVVPVFGQLVQTYRGAPEVRIAPLRAAAAAWAHGLISRREALAPFVEELGRMADESYAEIQDDEWFDTLLDAVLEVHPAGLEETVEALREEWGLQEDWDAELAEALEESEAAARSRLRETFPRFDRAMPFIERWDVIDSMDAEA